MTINKKDIIKLLETIAVYMELKGENPFKVSAFRKAAAALETDDRSLTEIEDFTALSGIGKGTAAVIVEYIEHNKSTVLEELQEEVPKGLIPLLQLQGLGGKKIAKLHKELAVCDVEDLKRVCEEGRVRDLAGFGKKQKKKSLMRLKMQAHVLTGFHSLSCSPLPLILRRRLEIWKVLFGIREQAVSAE